MWNPWKVPSTIISRHHILEERATPAVLHVIRSILWPWSQDARPTAIARVNAPIDRGQGLREIIWNGCRGGRFIIGQLLFLRRGFNKIGGCCLWFRVFIFLDILNS